MGLLDYVTLGIFWRLADAVGELCYPGACAVCQGSCASENRLCEACDQQLQKLADAPACARCAKPLAEHNAPCPWCGGRGIYPYQSIARLGVYDQPLRTLIHQMKYNRQWAMGEILADRLSIQPAVVTLLHQAEVLAPVPLHFRRQFSRGYNQSQVLAKRLSRKCGVKLIGAAKRIRDTETQTQLHSQKARRENVRGAFRLTRPGAVRGKRVVVIDDVMTSGATLQEIGRELSKAQPASLSAIVLAVADPRHRDFQVI